MIAFRILERALLAAAALLLFGCSNNNSDSVPKPRIEQPDEAQADPLPRASEPILTVTPKAAQAITEIAMLDNRPTWHLRVRLVPGGCSGFMHKLDIDTDVSPTEDYTFHAGGISVVVQKRQVEMLRGIQVDHGVKDQRVGFIINNPSMEGTALKKWLPILKGERSPPPQLTATERSEKIAQFRKLGKEDPDNELGHYRLGQLLMEDTRYAEAVTSFERTLQLNGDFSKAYQLLGVCHLMLKQKELAVTVLTKGLEVATKHRDEEPRKEIENLLAEANSMVSVNASVGTNKK